MTIRRACRGLTLVALAALAACETPAELAGSCLGAQSFRPDTSLTNVAFTDDCELPGNITGDVYQFTVSAQTNIRLSQVTSGFEGELALFKGSFNDPTGARLVFEVVGNDTIAAKAFLPAGTYFVVAGSGESAGGTYTLTSAPTTASPCSDTEFNWTVRGADLTGTIDGNDCPGAVATVRQDAYSLWLQAGESIAVTTTFTKNGNLLWRRSGNAAGASLVEYALVGNPLSVTLTAPDANSPYGIHLIGEPPLTGVGTYSISIR